jgi:hypothetical protein
LMIEQGDKSPCWGYHVRFANTAECIFFTFRVYPSAERAVCQHVTGRLTGWRQKTAHSMGVCDAHWHIGTLPNLHIIILSLSLPR